ncbi:MAG: thioredoxin-disulfide reductase [Acidaminococcus sp.]|jgi:thioredoxin reductase (NADPH)|nr:thioredoxin-disulfide reductase [Acidaminococcus sp.]MCI2100308.1 thioredoxin-disulfide reductase [Acidaminococcus sp.]MCI2114616.1 thioredoxin-disulfide reductase [Acidaminococcus sp.]MCI2116605.1 thioredoxin-disulfide reductase [Acidaminococcus sp.]
MTKVYDILVIGGGPAGYTAALYGARSGLSVAILEKLSPGGQMATTSEIENYPGFPDPVDGFELGEKMQEGAEKFGAETLFVDVESLDLEANPKVAHTSEGDYLGRTIILAMGASPRKLGIPREDAMIGRGIGYCAHCDGNFFKGKTIVVNGGGNSAVGDAIYLSRIGKEVHLVHRRDTLRATPIYLKRLEDAGVKIHWNRVVSGIEGDKKVTGVRLKNVKDGSEELLPCDALFIAVGRKPQTELVAGKVELDKAGYIVAGEDTKTSVPGVFAAGDIRTKALRQIVTAASDGACAANAAELYLSEQ